MLQYNITKLRLYMKSGGQIDGQMSSQSPVVWYSLFSALMQRKHTVGCWKKWTQWPWSASELYRPSDSHLSAKLVAILADRWCRVVSATDLRGRIIEFLDRRKFFFFFFVKNGWIQNPNIPNIRVAFNPKIQILLTVPAHEQWAASAEIYEIIK
jgi:hypothetical protein